MSIVSLSILVVLVAIYFFVARARIEKATGKRPKGWESLDDEMPYLAALGVSATVCFFLADLVFYYFDLGIEVSAEDVRHSIYVLFSVGLFFAFFAFFVPRALHFRYNTLSFSKPLSGFSALFLIISASVAIWPLIPYVAEKITQGLVKIWGFII